MANALQIITNALARIGAVGANRTPAEADQELGLQTLTDMLRRFIYSGSLGPRITVVPTSNYIARENEHGYHNSEDVETIDLTEFVADYATVSDYGEYATTTNTRTPRDGAFVIVTDTFLGETTEYLFDGPTKQWLDVSNLSLTDIVPFSNRDHTGLAACLACELADYYGQEIPPATLELQRRFKLNLTANPTEADVNDITRGTFF